MNPATRKTRTETVQQASSSTNGTLLAVRPGLGEKTLAKLIAAGYTTQEQLDSIPEENLSAINFELKLGPGQLKRLRTS